MAERWQIRGANCLVTGGASGIGARKVEALLNEGAEAVALLDADEAGGLRVAARRGRVTFIKCDLADEASVADAFNQAVAKLKRIDIIINNAAILDDSSDGWFAAVDINLKGVISMTRKGLEHMGKDKGGAGGAIVNVSSVGAFVDARSVPVYAATKSAVLWFGRSVALGDFYETTGIRMLTICYGATDTPILAVADRAFDRKAEKLLKDHLRVAVKQKAESAAKSCMEMIKRGANGTVWLSMNDEPPKDFTDVFNASYDAIRALMQ